MVHATVKVMKWGDSYGIILPKMIVRKLDIIEDDPVEINIVKHEKLSGFGLARGKRPISREDMDDMHEVGS